jgi:hypothetical protein
MATSLSSVAFLDPDPNQIARDVVALRNGVQCLAAEILLRYLPFEVDAMGSELYHGLHPLKSDRPVNY